MSECADCRSNSTYYVADLPVWLRGFAPFAGRSSAPHNQRGANGICSKKLTTCFHYQHYKRIRLHFSLRTRAYIRRHREKLMCLFIDRHGAR